jgi:hypothetical protein
MGSTCCSMPLIAAGIKKKKKTTTQFPRRLIKEKAEVRQSHGIHGSVAAIHSAKYGTSEQTLLASEFISIAILAASGGQLLHIIAEYLTTCSRHPFGAGRKIAKLSQIVSLGQMMSLCCWAYNTYNTCQSRTQPLALLGMV